LTDQYGHLNAVEFEKLVSENGRWNSSGQTVKVPLRSLYIARAPRPTPFTKANTPNTFVMDKYFSSAMSRKQATGGIELVAMSDEKAPKLGKPAPLTSYHKDGKFISFYGDNHPVYAGNVVKAMASAKDGYPYIVNCLKRAGQLNPAQQADRDAALKKLFANLDESLTATIVAINRLTRPLSK